MTDAFSTGFLTPLEFKSALRKAFQLDLLPKELSSVVNDFKDDNGNVDTAAFKSGFIRMGTEERTRLRNIRIEKESRNAFSRRNAEQRKLKVSNIYGIFFVKCFFISNNPNSNSNPNPNPNLSPNPNPLQNPF
jgi:hypothetical protein